MFDTLTDKLKNVFSKLTGKSQLSEENISEAVSEVRLALLEADVNYAVTKTLVKKIKEKAVGEKLIKSVTPGQQFIKIVHDELVELMGAKESELNFAGSPPVFMLCGLQGAGKTTHAAKIAAYLKAHKKVAAPLLVACDRQRPAAIDQLKTLAAQIGVPVFDIPGEADPIKVARGGLEKATSDGHDLVIIDTAGRLHVDEELMQQLKELKKLTQPTEVLFVGNASIGQDTVNVAKKMDEEVQITGTVLTMLDGTARGGAAISIKEVTQKPIVFEGVGEKITDLQIFNPTSMADRILGMGDTINLVKKAKEHIDEDEAKRLEQKIKNATFSYDDYLKQIQSVKKMGSIKSLLKMLPAMPNMPSMDLMNLDDKEFFKVEAMILSMTKDERVEKSELSHSRRKRISQGSGTTMEDINKLVKSFKQAKQFFKNMPNMKQLEKMLGGSLWR